MASPSACRGRRSPRLTRALGNGERGARAKARRALRSSATASCQRAARQLGGVAPRRQVAARKHARRGRTRRRSGRTASPGRARTSCWRSDARKVPTSAAWSETPRWSRSSRTTPRSVEQELARLAVAVHDSSVRGGQLRPGSSSVAPRGRLPRAPGPGRRVRRGRRARRSARALPRPAAGAGSAPRLACSWASARPARSRPCRSAGGLLSGLCSRRSSGAPGHALLHHQAQVRDEADGGREATACAPGRGRAWSRAPPPPQPPPWRRSW